MILVVTCWLVSACAGSEKSFVTMSTTFSRFVSEFSRFSRYSAFRNVLSVRIDAENACHEPEYTR